MTVTISKTLSVTFSSIIGGVKMVIKNNKLGLNWAKLSSSWDLTSLQLVCIE